jgi:uncharacterized protein (DUF302 family)
METVMSVSTAANLEADAPRYGIFRRVDLTYEQAVEKVTETLKGQGFGILTEIDVKKTLKQKLDKDFTKYVILGACNPPMAYKALTEEVDIGLLLPCNVTVYEDKQSGKTVVSAIDPEIMVEVTGREDLKDFAAQVKTMLVAALDAV